MVEVTLYHGNCLDILPTLQARGVDAIITDLPYKKTEFAWDKMINLSLLREYCDVLLTKNGVYVMFGIQPFCSELVVLWKDIFKHDWVWKKTSPTGRMNCHYSPMRSHEYILVFSRASATPNQFCSNKITYNPQGLIEYGKTVRVSGNKCASFSGRGVPESGYIQQEYTNYPRSVITFDIARPRLHPTQKPVALLEYLVKTYTNEGDTVLDATMGSGSTGVACVNTGRNFIGIELDAEYFRIAQERIEKAQMEAKQLELIK